jgi:SAM-dependent methyltransferase
MAAKGAETVYAVDEVPAHLAQCQFVTDALGVTTIRCLGTTLYRLGDHIEPVSLDLIFLGGVLYHLSDMLVGLLALRHLLKPGRLLISDLCEFMGFERPQIRFYTTGRCLARAVCPASATVPFKRGLNWAFAEIRDAVPRSTSSEHLAPRPLDPPR